MAEETFTDALCRYRHRFRILFMVSLLSLIVLGASLTVVERGTATFVITVIQIVTFLVIGSVSFGMMVFCGRKND